MTIQHALDVRIVKLQELQEQEKQRLRLQFLPALTRELDRVTACLDDLLTSRRLWAEVYQQPIFPADQTLRQTLRKPLESVARSSDVFTVEEDDLQAFQEETRDLVDKLSSWTRKLEHNIKAFCEERSTTVETTRTLLRIPDFFEDDAERQRIEELLDEVQDLLDLEGVGASDVADLAEKWNTVWSTFQELQAHLSCDALRQRFNLSEEAISSLAQFVSGDALRLSNLSVAVLGELQQIQRFAGQVSLRFEAD